MKKEKPTKEQVKMVRLIMAVRDFSKSKREETEEEIENFFAEQVIKALKDKKSSK